MATTKLLAEFECNGCGECCRDWQITVSKEIHDGCVHLLRTSPHPGEIDADEAFTVVNPNNREGYARINLRDDGRCVFLEADNLCYWHRHFGYGTKGLICRSYPLMSYESPSAHVVTGTMSCRPLAESLAANPRIHRLEPAVRADLASPLEMVTWSVNKGQAIVLSADTYATTGAFEAIRDGLIEFLSIEVLPVWARLMMGRLFVEDLVEIAARGVVLEAKHVQQRLAAVQADGTPLYLRADEAVGDAFTLAKTVKTFFLRIATIGMAPARAQKFVPVADALMVGGPPDRVAERLSELNARHWAGQIETLEPIMAAFAAHRIHQSKAVPRSGIVASLHDVIMALTLVWAYALGRASLLGRAIDATLLAESISDVEAIFFHNFRFSDCFSVGSGFELIHSVAFAAVLLKRTAAGEGHSVQLGRDAAAKADGGTDGSLAVAI